MVKNVPVVYAVTENPLPLEKQKILISKSVGLVGKRVLTSRDVLISYYIDKALDPSVDSVSHPKLSQLTVDSEMFSNELNSLLIEWMVYFEAKSFSTQKVLSDEIEKVQKNAGSRLNNVPEWKNLAVTNAEWNENFERKILAKKLIQFKRENSLVTVTDEDIKVYYEQNRVKFGSLPLAQFKENIKSYLKQQQIDQRLKEWLGILQQKYRMQNQTVEK